MYASFRMFNSAWYYCTMASRVPHLLEPYLLLPAESSLILLTNILSASTNWLVLRYLHSFLAKANNAEDESGREGTASVVLVSYLRDWAFWKEGARKLVSSLS